MSDEGGIEDTHALRCILFRHGIAADREEWTGKDGDRPLTDKGRRRVKLVAAGLKRLDVRATHILTSPLIRAVETARLLHGTFASRITLQLVDELLPEASPEKVIALLNNLPPDSCAFCVGHEPQLGLTASVLLSGRSSAAFPLKKAGACLIESLLPVRPGRGRLIWWLTPNQLRIIGKGKSNGED